jgi:hypothetical protein
MTVEKTTMAFGWRVYALGVMALGMASLAFGDFDPGQPVSENLPARTALAISPVRSRIGIVSSSITTRHR